MGTSVVRALQFVLLAIALATGAACGSSTQTTVTSPSTVRCQPSVTSSASSFGAAGGTGSLSIGVARECSWTVSTQAAWISFTSAREGQGDGTVTYRVVENGDPVARQAAISVGSEQVTLSQQAAACRYTITGPSTPVGSEGGATSVEVRAHTACSWTAASEVPYASVAPASGRGDGTVRVMVTPNDGDSRVIAVTVAGEHVSTMQAAAPVPVPAPAPTPTPPAPTPTPTPTPPPTPTPTPGPTPTPSPEPTPTPPPGPSPVSPIDISGQISSVSGTCPAVTFDLEGMHVYTTAATEFAKGPCKDLKNDKKVRVEGWLMSDLRVRADRVTFDK